mmetsp:Transcript_16419/g.28746  ORF Transcript_16419/g.28746 Transcript_16419/m.28746 type:complete len:246 (-) Transcript_16419:942-1679(-)
MTVPRNHPPIFMWPACHGVTMRTGFESCSRSTGLFSPWSSSRAVDLHVCSSRASQMLSQPRKHCMDRKSRPTRSSMSLQSGTQTRHTNLSRRPLLFPWIPPQRAIQHPDFHLLRLRLSLWVPVPKHCLKPMKRNPWGTSVVTRCCLSCLTCRNAELALAMNWICWSRRSLQTAFTLDHQPHRPSPKQIICWSSGCQPGSCLKLGPALSPVMHLSPLLKSCDSAAVHLAAVLFKPTAIVSQEDSAL